MAAFRHGLSIDTFAPVAGAAYAYRYPVSVRAAPM
jgi:hypothetical protein